MEYERERSSVLIYVAVAIAVASLGIAFIGVVLPQFGEIDPARWDDLNFPALSLGKGVNAPTQAVAFGSALETLHFDGINKMQEVFGMSEILHNWKEGTDLSPHIHWMPTTTDIGDVQWFLEYTWIDKNGTYVSTSTINATQTADGTAWKHNYVEFPDVQGVGFHIGSQIVFRLYRNATSTSDTYAADAALLSFGIHYQMNSVGSLNEMSK